MTQHSEQFHIKRVFEDHITPLLNDHHANVAFYYYDRSLRKYIVHAGPRSKKRLEFLLENDAQLKKAIKKDDDESNRCYEADFVENNLNTVRGRVPIARLKQKLKPAGASAVTRSSTWLIFFLYLYLNSRDLKYVNTGVCDCLNVS